MDKTGKIFSSLGLLFFLAAITPVKAGILYETDFDSGNMPIGSANPVWMLPSGASDRFGTGNLFEVVTGNAHSGSYSLRFNYEGRNGVCNMCGSTARVQMSTSSPANYFLDDQGNDLTLDPILASPGRIVYNTDDGFSKWQITSVTSQNSLNDKLLLTKINDGIGAASNIFKSGDKINIYRQCGVDGKVGTDVTRRSDCNIGITYFTKVTQNYGESIFRRIYVKIDKNTVLPYTQKLRYWQLDSGGIYLVVRHVDTGRIFPYVEGLAGHNGPSFIDTNIDMKTGVWYYVEEQFKANSDPTTSDGEYRLWFAESGKEAVKPVIELTGLDISPVKAASLWGNFQHHEDASGYWYLDDLAISTTRIGPTDIPPRPMPPSIIK